MYYVIQTEKGLEITKDWQRDWSRVKHRAFDYNLAAEYVQKTERRRYLVQQWLYSVGFVSVMLAVMYVY